MQVYLDDHEMERLEAWVCEHGWTKSQAVRAAIRALTRRHDEDPLLQACGMIEDLPEDLSRRIDDYVEETFVAKKRCSTNRKRRGSR